MLVGGEGEGGEMKGERGVEDVCAECYSLLVDDEDVQSVTVC